MTINSLILFVNSSLNTLDKELEDEKKERQEAGQELEEGFCFANFALDSEGMPTNFGNADDVHEAAFYFGEKQGQYDTLMKIKEMLDKIE